MHSVMLLKYLVTVVIVYLFSTKCKHLLCTSMCNDEQVPLQLYFFAHLPPFLSTLCLFVLSN